MRYSYEFKRKAIELFYLNTKLWDKMVLIWVHIKVIKMKKLFLNLEVTDGYPPVSMESILKIVHCGLFSLMRTRNLKIKY